MNDLIETLEARIRARRKMTSPLYQVILSGRATRRLLQSFVIHRYPIKNFWTRNILGIASRIDDYALRVELVENIFEEETGYITGSGRHLESFLAFGQSVGVTRDMVADAPLLPETKAVIDHNVQACNDSSIHFTAGVASVLLLMEGQPPIVSDNSQSMLAVMRDVYGLPPKGYDFFVHHASATGTDAHVSELEDDHAGTAREILRRYCDTPRLHEQAVRYLDRALQRRHEHFDAILRTSYDAAEPAFRYANAA